MKLIKEGMDIRTNWWVGKYGKCVTCGAEVQLESTDKPEFAAFGTVAIKCPNANCPSKIYVCPM